MREEEKLARDVYTHLGAYWNQRIFSQIALSEQQHMDAVKILLDKYSLSDPVAELDIGNFRTESFQLLYSELIMEGEMSLERALTVGAIIEDMDIADLLNMITQSDNQDDLTLWQNLAKGSRNHLRAFTSRMELFNLSYTPKYLSADVYERIIQGEMERGFYDASGNPHSPTGGWCRSVDG